MANPYFNAAYYLLTNKDVVAAGYTLETAEQHYIQYGASEAFAGGENITPTTLRKPAPWFDIEYYLAAYPDLLENGVTPGTAFQHFANHGISEGRSPNEYTSIAPEDLSAYAASNPDLQEAFGITNPDELSQDQETALAQHFYQYGYQEDRSDLPNLIDNAFTTTDGDELIGTQYNDTFVANADGANPTLQSGDSVDGAGGNNVLEIGAGAISAEASPELSNIQKIVNADVRGGPVYLNLDNADALQNVETSFAAVNGAFAGAFYSHASADTVFTLSNTQAQVEGAGRASIHAGGTGADGKGGLEHLNLVLDNNAEGSYYTVNAGDGNVSSGTATYDITTLEGNDGMILLNKFVEGITVTGAGNFGLTQRAYNNLVDIDASDVTGDVAIGNNMPTFGDLKLGNDFVIETGEGNDTIDLTTVETTGYVDAGAGDDTISVNLDAASDSLWTLAGGQGADTFAISGANWDDGSDVIITDFNGADGDTLELGFGDNATTLVADNIIRNVVLNSQTADEAIGKLVDTNAFAGDANVAVFEFGANTYAVYEAEGDAGYGAIQLTGVGLGLDADNIDGMTTA